LLKNSYERHCDPPQAEKQSQPACGGLFLTFSDCFVPPEADHGGLLAKTTERTFSTPPLSLFYFMVYGLSGHEILNCFSKTELKTHQAYGLEAVSPEPRQHALRLRA